LFVTSPRHTAVAPVALHRLIRIDALEKVVVRPEKNQVLKQGKRNRE
jgi:hypothetical protein